VPAGGTARRQTRSMIHHNERLPGRLAPVCELGSIGSAQRTLALAARDDRPVVCYAVRPNGSRRAAEAMAERIRRLAEFKNQHALPIESVTLGLSGTVWLITPYTGNQDGLVTLDDLAQLKAGRCSPFEVARAMTQLFEVSVAAHASGFFHGPLRGTEILVDPRGSLLAELYGIRRVLEGFDCDDERIARDEVSSIAEIGYHMMTGIAASGPRVRPSRLVKRLDRAWDDWFDEALDPSAGFDSSADALNALPGNGEMVRASTPRRAVVLSRLRRVASDRRSEA
jgi:hypothetical protein